MWSWVGRRKYQRQSPSHFRYFYSTLNGDSGSVFSFHGRRKGVTQEGSESRLRISPTQSQPNMIAYRSRSTFQGDSKYMQLFARREIHRHLQQKYKISNPNPTPTSTPDLLCWCISKLCLYGNKLYCRDRGHGGCYATGGQTANRPSKTR